MTTATAMRENDYRIDLRRRRAVGVLHHILQHVRPHLRDDADVGKIADSILREVYELGAEFVTDQEREHLGLPPRGGDGWTDDEIRALEAARLEAICRPLQIPNEKAAAIAGLRFPKL